MASVRERTNTKPAQKAKRSGQISNGDIVGRTGPEQSQGNATLSRNSVATTILSPALVATFVLIFGGCCSNVYTLESILSLSPATGSLVTCLQFFLTAIFALPSQITTAKAISSSTRSSSSSFLNFVPGLRSRSVPIYKWITYTVMFLTVNILNNKAFNYHISIPLHIIIRSAGPVTSMLIGYLVAGRRYEFRRVVAVALLFTGVVLAALSDASSKGKLAPASSFGETNARSSGSEFSKQVPGFILIFSALVISACMGLYTDQIYQQHGRSAAVASENLFYSHMLSLPYFASQTRGLSDQFSVMITNASVLSNHASSSSQASKISSLLYPVTSYIPLNLGLPTDVPLTPIFLLFANACTQIVCISGVNRLAAQTTSLTVSVVLNVRKLVSLLLSIWLFGNRLSTGVTIGAVLVFLGGGLYGLPSSKPVPNSKKDAGQEGATAHSHTFDKKDETDRKDR